MINLVRVTNAENVLNMELREPEKSGFLVRDIQGLGSGTSDIRNTDYASLPGSIYDSSRKPVRNIIFQLRLLWHDTVEKARHESERYFPLGKKVKLEFFCDDRETWIEGYVESNEPTIFTTTKQEGIDCQISILCTDPAFKSFVENSVGQTKLDGGFYFIFPRPTNDFPEIPGDCYDDSYEDPDKYRLAMSTILRSSYAVTFNYDGTAQTGCVFHLYFNEMARRVELICNRSGKSILIAPDDDHRFQSGDTLIIDTRDGSKSVYVVRDGEYINYLGQLVQTSDFDGMKLTKGSNTYRLSIDKDANNDAADLRLEYRNAYWSV